MPRPPRKAFKTRRQAFQLGLQKEGFESYDKLTPGKRVKVRENAKKLLREKNLSDRLVVYAVALVIIITTVFISVVV